MTLPRLRHVLLALPFVVLLVEVLIQLKWAVDVPYMDDWRIFFDRDAGSFALVDLFRSANDTMFPTGKLLDALAVHVLDYNAVAYQTLSMIACLGGLLALQLALLRRSAVDPALSLVPFAATVFMLQTGTYWGIQSLAYHQALPLLAVLAGLYVQLFAGGAPLARIAVIALVGILGGFAYISGAFAMFAVACVAFACAILARQGRGRFAEGAIGFGLAALVTLPPQLWVVLVGQSGHVHVEGAGWTLPWDWRFWAYLLGMVQRSFGFHLSLGSLGPSDLACALVLLLFLVVPSIFAIRTFLGTRTREPAAADFGAYIYLAVLAAVASYVFLVVAGRADVSSPDGADWTNFFFRGGHRFHFFWITLLVPWAVYAWFAAIGPHLPPSRTTRAAAAIAALVLPAIALFGGLLDFDRYYGQMAREKGNGLACIAAKRAAGEPLNCPDILPIDLTNAYAYARTLDVTFVEKVEAMERAFAANGPAQSASADATPFRPIAVRITDLTSQNGMLTVENDTARLEGRTDPQFIVRIEGEGARAMETCEELRVSANLSTGSAGMIQLFYRPLGVPDFAETYSAKRSYDAGGIRSFELTATSPGGFAPILRLDPGEEAGPYSLSGLTVSCR